MKDLTAVVGELVAEWRSQASNLATGLSTWMQQKAKAYAECADELESTLSALTAEAGKGEVTDIYDAYKTWPADVRKKLSCHDLRRMSGWGRRPDLESWRIDTSAGRPILVYENCSVIEDEQARYVLSLIAADTAQAQKQKSELALSTATPAGEWAMVPRELPRWYWLDSFKPNIDFGDSWQAYYQKWWDNLLAELSASPLPAKTGERK